MSNLEYYFPTFASLLIPVVLYFLFKNLKKSFEKKDDNSEGNLMLQQQMSEILKSNQDLHLSNEKLKNDLTEKINEKMNEGQKEMSESVRQQFEHSQKLIKDITLELGEVKKQTGNVVGFAEQLKNLQDILQNSKQRGALGEYFLETTIKNVLPPENYEFQYSFKDGKIADAVIKLEAGKILAIDSKFSLENYNKIISENDPEKKKNLERIFKEDLKKRIQETTKYIKPREGTMDFAFMFIPSEGIYYDLLISKIGIVNSQNFLEYAFREKKVVVVSPSTLYAYLQTIMQGLKALQIEKQATHIIKRVEDLQKHLVKYQTYHEKLGNSLGTVINHYNVTSKTLSQISYDTSKITNIGEKEEFELLDKPKS